MTLHSSLQKIALPTVFLVLVVGAWHFTLASGQQHFLAPTPYEAAAGIVELWHKGVLVDYIAASLFRVLSGFVLAAIFGIPLGFFMGWWRPLHQTLNPMIQMIRPISPIAWIPLVILWFGLSEASPIFLIFLACLFPIILATVSAVKTINDIWLKTAANLQLPKAVFFGRVIAPAILPEVLTGLRVSLGVGWMVVVAAEMIVVNPRTGGLGYLVNDARSAGRYDLVVSAMIVIGLVGLMLDFGIRQFESIKEVSWAFGLKGRRNET